MAFKKINIGRAVGQSHILFMASTYVIFFIIAFLLSAVLTLAVRYFSSKFKIIDCPDTERKFHGRPVPLLGGTAIFLSFWAIVGYILFFKPLLGVEILGAKLWLAFLASLVLIIIGAVDDIRGLPVSLRIIISAGAILFLATGDVWLDKINNPFGGVLRLDSIKLGLGFLGQIPIWSALLAFIWLTALTFAMKILDGLDGLSAGIGAIGSLVIFVMTNLSRFFQPNIGLLSLIFAACCLGFLVFNFYPAKIFLGEGGGLFLGFMLGILSIISGGKMATALLVVAVPVLDLARVGYARWRKGWPIFKGDREHLHFRLLDMGLGQRKAVLLFYFLSAGFGVSALFLQSIQKFYALIFLVLIMAVVAYFLGRKKV